MFTVKVGFLEPFHFDSLRDAFVLAIDCFKEGAECEVISELTGEVLLILRDNVETYMTDAIHYTV